ncbi:MAG: DUF6259 domain-containing protein [Chloroflexota bacterium]
MNFRANFLWFVACFGTAMLFTTSYVEQATLQSETIYFDDSTPDVIRMGNDAYEIGIRKTNGSIAYIQDKATQQNITEGSRHECLWGSVYRDVGLPDSYIGGCFYHRDDPTRNFDYTWHPTDSRLSMAYISASDATLNVWIDFTLSTSNSFDLKLFLDNKSGEVVENVFFPSDLVFLQDGMQEGLVPTMPGVLLNADFFTTFLPSKADPSYTVVYPSWPGIFSDYLALKSDKGDLAMYSIYKEDDIVATRLGFIYDAEAMPYIEDSFYTYHTFNPAIEDDVVWDSPTVRIHIGKNYPDTLAALRQDNRFDSYPSLEEKLADLYAQTTQSPIIKLDRDHSMAEYEAIFLDIPAPAILHWVSYWNPSFDEDYPDFLPPHPEWGSTADMAALFDQAKANGHLNMPYINPTWWDDESPTFQGQDVASIAIIDEHGEPLYECYSGHPDPPECTPENAKRDSPFNSGQPPYLWLHGGYAVSPYAPFVQQRVAELMTEVTQDIPSDFIFEDQIGAGDRGLDYNVHAPRATSYLNGWLDHTQAFADARLMTETGYDLLARTEVGFHGSYLLLERQHDAPRGWWGEENWQPYPLATMLARDKVLFYQHNLAPETFTHNKETLTWNLAMGFMLSYDLRASAEFGGGLESAWLDWVSLLQREVLAAHADELVVDFRRLQAGVSATEFETFTITAVWDNTPYDTGTHIVAPHGVFATSETGHVSAGVFNSYNGAPLTTGDHYLLEKRLADRILVWQPIGADTEIVIKGLPSWGEGTVVFITAYNKAQQEIGQTAVLVENGHVRLDYQASLNGEAVAHYKLSRPTTYLPLVVE